MRANNIPLRKMRAAIVEVAIADMRTGSCLRSKRGNQIRYRRLKATVWLGSATGGVWFQACGLGASHTRILAALDWPRHATEVLDSGKRISNTHRGTTISKAQRNVLEIGIGTLFMLREPRYVSLV